MAKGRSSSEKLKKAARENGKKGGRPKGLKNQATLEREAVLREFKQKVMRSADVLFNRQMKLAEGHMYLYKIEKEVIIGPKGGKKIIPKKPVRVTDEKEIELYLLEALETGGLSDPEDTYYYVTVEKGDNKAIDSMFDRAFGRATQVLATEDEEGKRKEISVNSIIFVDNESSS